MKSDNKQLKYISMGDVEAQIIPTHSAKIGVLNDDGSITSVLCSSRGELKWTGELLRKYFKTAQETRRLLRSGDFLYLNGIDMGCAVPINPGMGMMERCAGVEDYVDTHELLLGEIRNYYLFTKEGWKYKCSMSKKSLQHQHWKRVDRALENYEK